MANITIQNLEVESTALNQVSPGEMEKVIGGQIGIAGASWRTRRRNRCRKKRGFPIS